MSSQIEKEIIIEVLNKLVFIKSLSFCLCNKKAYKGFLYMHIYIEKYDEYKNHIF